MNQLTKVRGSPKQTRMDEAAPKLRNVVRLDSLPVTKAEFTPEGYLVDKPILTTTGIFEYHNPDGSIRRELRLPEEVFDKESLSSYKGKPIIITHDAGLVTKDNVHRFQIGTILTEGIRSGDNVKAEIVIHDTDKMKDCRLKELSLGYNLELEEEPGVWHGQHYDAIQRNISVNHLALVREARAGEQARLNLDSRDANINILTGGRPMRKVKKARRNDGILTPEELAKAIEMYKASHKVAEDADDEVVEEEAVKEPVTVEEKVEYVKDRRDRRDEEGDPKDEEEAMGIIANQDEDIDYLFDIIDTLLAERDMKQDDCDEENKLQGDEGEEEVPEELPEEEKTDAEEEEMTEEEEVVEDAEDEELPEDEETDADEEEELTEEELVEDEDEELLPEDEETDGDDDDIPEATEEEKPLNMDAVDKIVRERIKLGMVGRALHLDGLENLRPVAAKKRIIKAVNPSIRLDGKSAAYIDAAYDVAVNSIKSAKKKTTGYQKRQMFNKDSRSRRDAVPSAASARDKMIARHNHK